MILWRVCLGPVLSSWPTERWHLDVYGFVVVPNTLDAEECAVLLAALRTLKEELLKCPEDPAPHIRGHGPGRGGSFIRVSYLSLSLSLSLSAFPSPLSLRAYLPVSFSPL